MRISFQSMAVDLAAALGACVAAPYMQSHAEVGGRLTVLGRFLNLKGKKGARFSGVNRGLLHLDILRHIQSFILQIKLITSNLIFRYTSSISSKFLLYLLDAVIEFVIF